jgi:hypothetical protein
MLMRFPISIIAAASAVLTVSAMALAGEQYIDETCYAVSGYDVVAYFDPDQAAIGETQPAAVPGDKDIIATHNGATFVFSTERNRERFLATPEAASERAIPDFSTSALVD